MASYTAVRATHQTLTATTVDTVTLTGSWETAMITNRTGANEIYITGDGTTPTVGGADSWVLPAAVGSRVIPVNPVPNERDGTGGVTNLVVKLISAGAMAYSVEGIE